MYTQPQSFLSATTNYLNAIDTQITHRLHIHRLQDAMQQSITKLALLSQQLDALEMITHQTRTVQSLHNYQCIFDQYQNEYNVCLRLNQSIANVTSTNNINTFHQNHLYNTTNSLISYPTIPQHNSTHYISYNVPPPTATSPPQPHYNHKHMPLPPLSTNHTQPQSTNIHNIPWRHSYSSSYLSPSTTNQTVSISNIKQQSIPMIALDPGPPPILNHKYCIDKQYRDKPCNFHFKQCVEDSLCDDAKLMLIASKTMVRNHSDWFTQSHIFSDTALLHNVIKCFLKWIKNNIPEQSKDTNAVYEFMLHSISSILLNTSHDVTICCVIQCTNRIMDKTMHSAKFEELLFGPEHGLIIKLFSSNLMNPSRHRNILLHLSKTLLIVCKMVGTVISVGDSVISGLMLNKLTLLLFYDDLEILSHVLRAFKILIEDDELYLEIESIDITDIMLLYHKKHDSDVMLLNGFVSSDGRIPLDVVGVISKYYCCYRHARDMNNTLERMMNILDFASNSCSYFVRHYTVEILRSIVQYEGEELVFSLNENVLDVLGEKIQQNDDILVDLYWLIHDIMELNVDEGIRDAFDADLIKCMIDELWRRKSKIDLNVLTPLWSILQFLRKDKMRIVIEEYDFICVFCGLLMDINWSDIYEHRIVNNVLNIFYDLLDTEWEYNDISKAMLIEYDAIKILEEIRRKSKHPSVRYRALGILAIHFDICDAKEQELEQFQIAEDDIHHNDYSESSMEFAIYDSDAFD